MNHVLYKGETVVGKVTKVKTSSSIMNTKWEVVHPGGSFFYFGPFYLLKEELSKMGYSL